MEQISHDLKEAYEYQKSSEPDFQKVCTLCGHTGARVTILIDHHSVSLCVINPECLFVCR